MTSTTNRNFMHALYLFCFKINNFPCILNDCEIVGFPQPQNVDVIHTDNALQLLNNQSNNSITMENLTHSCLLINKMAVVKLVQIM